MTLSQVIRNTINFRKRFAKLPRKAIDLDEFIYREHGTAYKPCNTVGCLAGWAFVWYGSIANRHWHLGINEFRTDILMKGMFSGKQDHSLTHRAEALQRLDQRIKELKALRRY